MSCRRCAVDASFLHKLHSTPVSKLNTTQIVQTLKAIEAGGDRRESAQRAASLVSRVWRYAVQTGHLATNPASALRGALKPIKRESLPALTTPRSVGGRIRGQMAGLHRVAADSRDE